MLLMNGVLVGDVGLGYAAGMRVRGSGPIVLMLLIRGGRIFIIALLLSVHI